MGNLRLYRDIYRIEFSSVTGETYTLVDVFSISASSFKSGSTSVIETPTVFRESTGKYYVELNPILYTFDDIYELKWTVGYTSSASPRILITRFRLKPFNIAGVMSVEVVDDDIMLELARNEIIIEIGNEAQ